MDEVEKVYQEFWKPIISPNGEIDCEQIKKELYDYHCIMREVSKVYDHITRGRISKPNTVAEAVIGEADDIFNKELAAIADTAT